MESSKSRRFDAMETTAPGPAGYSPRRFSVSEYYRMVDVGILEEDDKVELIDGVVVVREPPGPSHSSRILRLSHFLTHALGDQALVRSENPLHIGVFDEPEPDVTVLKYRHDFYEAAHPEPDDVLLLAEVALSSLRADRRIKVPLYAQAGVRELWIVNIPDLVLEIYRRPSQGEYLSVTRLTRDAHVRMEAFPTLEFNVGDIIG